MVTLDSDGQHDPDQIAEVIEPLKQGFDIVVGSRFLKSDGKQKIPRYRSFGIKTITKLTQAASYNGLTDSQSGFRAYNKNALSKINLFEDGMAVSTEILLRASEKKLLTTEVPITINYDLKDTSTHNPISHGIGVLYSVFQFISLRHPLAFYGLPGIVILGIAALFYETCVESVFPNRIRIYQYNFDICWNSSSRSRVIGNGCNPLHFDSIVEGKDKQSVICRITNVSPD